MSDQELTNNRPKRISWGSYTAFLIAAVGASIGLGNLWKFPYEAGLHGGGTFLVVYLPAVLLIAFPLIIAELMLGRMGQSNPVFVMRRLADSRRLSSLWQSIGWVGMLTSVIVFSFYSVVSGWTLYYAMNSATGAFQNMPPEIVQNSFGALLRNPVQLLLWHSVFVLCVIRVLARDIRRGVEIAMRILMPIFVGGLVWLTWNIVQFANLDAALEFMFTVRWEFFSVELFVSAVTQALFSMSIGIGIIMMYGSYVSERRPLIGAAAIISLFDTLIALTMSVLIFSIVFAFGMRPDAGAGLIFQTLPVAFAQMHENSVLISTTFFVFMGAAALFSGFALLEPAIAWMVDRWDMTRRRAAWIIGAIAWVFGLLSIASFGDFGFSFYYFGVERTDGYFDLFNLLATHVLMPFSALLIAIFAGRRIERSIALEALNVKPRLSYRVWRLGTRYVAPLVLILVLACVLFIPA